MSKEKERLFILTLGFFYSDDKISIRKGKEKGTSIESERSHVGGTGGV